MKNKAEIIDRRIRSLFGEIGCNKGQFYCYGGTEIVKVVNDFGGVRSILRTRSMTDLIYQLDAIETYVQFKQYENKGA